jgi:hypothetical protein
LIVSHLVVIKFVVIEILIKIFIVEVVLSRSSGVMMSVFTPSHRQRLFDDVPNSSSASISLRK